MENVVLNESMEAKVASRLSYLVYYNCIWSEFEHIITKLRWSRLISTTTTNCRVSFIDFYLVFPPNFRIVYFYPIQTL